MLATARGYIDSSVWMSIFPGLAIMLVVLGFNFLGDGLRDILDPRIGGSVANVERSTTSDGEHDRSIDVDLLVRDALSSTAPGARRSAATWPSRTAGSPRVGDLDDAQAERGSTPDGRVVCPGFVDPHSHSDFTLLTNPTAQSDDPAGRDDRGRRQLRLDVRARPEASRPFVEARMRTFAYDGPIEWATFGEHLSFLSARATRRTSRGSSATTRCATRPASSRPSRPRRSCGAMERPVAEAMDAGALGLSTGLEFNPAVGAPRSSCG